MRTAPARGIPTVRQTEATLRSQRGPRHLAGLVLIFCIGCESPDPVPPPDPSVPGWGCDTSLREWELCDGGYSRFDEDPCPAFWKGIENGTSGWGPFPHEWNEVDLSRLELVQDVAYLELRSQDTRSQEFEVVASAGTVCGDALDSERCVQGWEALVAVEPRLHAAAASAYPPVQYYLAWTRGDDVGAVEDLDSLRSFLAPLREPESAMFLLGAGWFWWSHDNFPVHAFRQTDGGFEAVLTELVGWGPARVDVQRWTLDSSGDVEMADDAVFWVDCGITIGR